MVVPNTEIQLQKKNLQHPQTNKHRLELFTKQVVFQVILKVDWDKISNGIEFHKNGVVTKNVCMH